MSGLHERGYRPKPGERAATRFRWRGAWLSVRCECSIRTSTMRAARECLDAREAPDPLHVAAFERQHVKARARVRGLQRSIGKGLTPAMTALVERVATYWGES